MIAVLSIGGSILEKDADKIRAIADAVREIASKNKVFVVCGGGPTSREYIKVARALGASEAVCDMLGIDATRLNARLLISATKDACKIIPKTYEEAAAQKENIVIMGGVSPGHTTDAVAAILAEYVGADLLVNATSIDGVYSADPKKDKNARKFQKLTPRQLVEIVSKVEMTAGPATVFDLLASKIIERSGIKTIVVDGRNPENIVGAVRGKHSGTEIVR